MDKLDVMIPIIISILALIISCIGLGWNIYRDCIDKAKLKIDAYIAEIITFQTAQPLNVLQIKITNIGKKSIVVSRQGFLLRDGKQILLKSVFSQFDNKKLEPGEYLSVTIPNEDLCNLALQAEEIRGLIVLDTSGKKWNLKSKKLNEFLADLIKFKNKIKNH